MQDPAPSVLTRDDLPFLSEPVLESLRSAADNLLAASLTLLAFWLIWKALQLALVPLLDRSRLDTTSAHFVRTLVKYVVLAIGAVAAVGELGVDTTSLVASLGVAGLTVGFAARDVLADVVAGFFIYWDRPFVIDDLVEIGDHYGRVDRITMRSTRVVTPDGRMLAVPNTEAVTSVVASYTNFPHLRVDVPLNVGLEEDLGRVRRLLLEMVREREGVLDDPAPSVWTRELGDYAVTVTLMAWIEDERAHLGEKADLREEAFERLRAEGIDMPYETLSLTPLEVRNAGGEPGATSGGTPGGGSGDAPGGSHGSTPGTTPGSTPSSR